MSKKSPLFMMAQLPFNNTETVELNSPMIPIMDEKGNIDIAKRNLIQLQVLNEMLQAKKTVLEIGCGNGYLEEYLYKNGKGDYFALEPIESEYKKTLANLEEININPDILKNRFHCGILSPSLFPQVQFDFIYSYHVFEHLENPLEMIEFAKERLSKNGKLIITCPNVEGFIPQHHLAVWRCSIASHRWLPGLKTITRVLKESGFKVEKCFTYGGYPTPRNIWKNLMNYYFKWTNQGDVMTVMALRN